MVKMHFKCWRMPITVGPNLMRTGWYGGQWVKFVGNLVVEKASITEVAGFLINGYKLEDIDGKPFKYTDMDGLKKFVPFQYENKSILAQERAVISTDDGLYDFNKNVYDNSVVYNYNQKLYVNADGILTNINLGSPLVGIVAGLPSDNNSWLRVMLRM